MKFFLKFSVGLMDEEVTDRLNLKSLCLRAITVNYFHQNKHVFSKCEDSKQLMKKAQWGLKLPTEFRIKVLQAVNQTCHELSRWTEKHSALFSDKRQNRVRHFKLDCRNSKICTSGFILKSKLPQTFPDFLSQFQTPFILAIRLRKKF